MQEIMKKFNSADVKKDALPQHRAKRLRNHVPAMAARGGDYPDRGNDKGFP